MAPTATTQRIQWQIADDQAAWTATAAETIADALAADLDADGRAVLLLSGGNTPAPVYRALAQAPIDWARVHVGLVDERWTGPESAGSNARLVRETLLTGAAAQARFRPLVETLDDPERAAFAADQWLASLGVAPGVIVFGMGDDGHTASLFPRAGGLEHALATDDAYAVIDATGREGAGSWPTRITLTPAAFARAKRRLLLIHGATKRRVFELALAGSDAHAMPVRAAVDAGTTPLRVHWYP